jgi:predicted dehydrogenase
MEDRRTFLAKGAAGVAALGTSALSSRAASDEIAVALIGCGSRGLPYLLPNFKIVEGVRIAAVCDVFKPNLEKGAAAAGPKVDTYGDYRRILDRKDINVVIVATPDHWHGPITIAACEAGKDVYVEKPLSNSISACLNMVQAARKYNRVVQAGLQQRNSAPFQEAYKLVQSGMLGKIRQVLVINPTGNPRSAAPPVPTSTPTSEPIPEGLDWEMFQGPAPRRPYSRMRQRSWRDFWEYGAGTLSDWGVHVLDVAHWYLGVNKPPVTAAAAYAWVNRPANDGRTPDTVDVAWRYDNFVASYSSRGDEVGTYLYGDLGMLHVNRNGYSVRPSPGNRGPDGKPGFEAQKVALRDEAPGNSPSATSDTGKHVRNFLECVRTRQRPVVDVEIAAMSTIPTLMGALSILNQGKTIAWMGDGARPLA